MITFYDTTVIGFYLLFMLTLGLAFRRLSKNTSDYFRCGGAMPWWITGASAWVATFSAWAFVGAASEVYRSGLKVLLLFYAGTPALILVLIFTSVRFRRMRVITWMEAVRERFGPRTEQFYTWIKIPVELLKAGIGLMSISVFMAAVFNVPVNTVIVVLGITITLVAFAGGAFAVLASDFVQLFLVMTITCVTMILTFKHPDIGGVSGLLAKVNVDHPEHLRWWISSRPVIIVAWGLAFAWVKFAELNSMEFSTMYLMSKSERHARSMVWIPLIGGLLGPLIWVVPPLAATIFFPNLATVFPSLSKPTEGAFVATAMKVMPIGLLGLLMCGMFGATLTNMDAALNKYVGVFIRSFYQTILKPSATEAQLLIASKLCTLLFGTIVLTIAVVINSNRQTDVFTLLNQLAVSLGIPLTIPVFFGLFYRRTPDWSAWATALACFSFSAWANFIFAREMQVSTFLTQLPPFLRNLIGDPAHVLSATERNDLLLAVTALGTSLVGVIVFFGSTVFYRSSPAPARARNEDFFSRLHTPLPHAADANLSDEPVYRLLGLLCMVYGAFILLLMLIPNATTGRLCFLFIGGVLGSAGVALYSVANHKRRRGAVDSRFASTATRSLRHLP